MVSLREYITNCENMVNNSKYHYLYGYKNNKITHDRNMTMKKNYPNVWTTKYFNTAERWVGDMAIDCSGFVLANAGEEGMKVVNDFGSWYMSENWESWDIGNELENRDICGFIGWRPGHVVVCSGKINNGMIEILESSSQKVGLRKRWANKGEFKKFLMNPYVNYNSESLYKVGWNYDKNRGWWYADTDTTYLKNGYYNLKWSQGVDKFYFDESGWCVITDSNGVVKEPK